MRLKCSLLSCTAQLHFSVKMNIALNTVAFYPLVVPPTFTSASNTGGSAKNLLTFPTHLTRVYFLEIPIMCHLLQVRYPFFVHPEGPAEHFYFIWLCDSAALPLNFKRSGVWDHISLVFPFLMPITVLGPKAEHKFMKTQACLQFSRKDKST